MNTDKAAQYATIIRSIRETVDASHDHIANMATLSCALYHGLTYADWVGFYRVTAPKMLQIGPYQGSAATVNIPFDKGVCGACARTERLQLVDDVHAFDGHIACSLTSKSEVVLPVFDVEKQLIAVLDIDSDQAAAFDQTDAKYLEKILSAIFSRDSEL